uniref:Uncharacterized protein n=1 Tax=Triticum urartu TaxID=4572 RepID=A0A8R7RBU2_TRIUA
MYDRLQHAEATSRLCYLVSYAVVLLLVVCFASPYFEELHKHTQRNVDVLTPQQHLGHLCRRNLHRRKQFFNLREESVVVDKVVVPCQRLEGLPATVSHVDVHVHAARP